MKKLHGENKQRGNDMKIVKPSAFFVWATPMALHNIEEAGRTAYKSEDCITDTSAEAFVRMVLKRGHESVLEHAVASFRFVCDRGVTHELVRHRLISCTQESTRFCNYSKGKFDGAISVIIPPDIQDTDKYVTWFQACTDAEIYYLKMLEEGCKPEIARSVLPTCLKTEIVVTANFREWRHILKLRAVNPQAHPQIREVMMDVLQWFKDVYPVIVEDLVQGLVKVVKENRS